MGCASVTGAAHALLLPKRENVAAPPGGIGFATGVVTGLLEPPQEFHQFTCTQFELLVRLEGLGGLLPKMHTPPRQKHCAWVVDEAGSY